MKYIKHAGRVFHRISKHIRKERIEYGEPAYSSFSRKHKKKLGRTCMVESSPIFGQSSANLKLDPGIEFSVISVALSSKKASITNK